ncbi:hypothetical protein [Deinococcus arcticus]|uniref:hypothetical protein n=1 Tax=Deinococcus arcticus TaxID=2136176 RepID=UPI001E530D2D|nr:hypothetical protein [Deinococcus arcticus]
MQLLARLSEDRRLATLLVFLQHLERSATDDALDVFDAFMSKLTLTGLGRRKKERLRTLKDLDQAALRLRTVARVLLDSGVSPAGIREADFALVDARTLEVAIDTVEALANEDDDPAVEVLVGAYATVRRFLPAMLAGIALEGTPGAQPLLDAWQFLGRLEAGGRGKPRWADAPGRSYPEGGCGGSSPGPGKWIFRHTPCVSWTVCSTH